MSINFDNFSYLRYKIVRLKKKCVKPPEPNKHVCVSVCIDMCTNGIYMYSWYQYDACMYSFSGRFWCLLCGRHCVRLQSTGINGTWAGLLRSSQPNK